MQLSDYQWSGNPRGMHNTMVWSPFRPERYIPLQLGWYKFVCGGAEYIEACQTALSLNITPVIRIYRATPGAMAPDAEMVDLWTRYIRLGGARWFEFYNEPNLANPEWPHWVSVHHRNFHEVIRPLVENWLSFAEIIIRLGGYPAFPALAEANTEAESTTLWLDALLSHLRDRYRDRFIAIANNGLWLASHPYTLNHFYQETPGNPLRPREPEEQNGAEGGWHFEYPYDPISQRSDPGRTVWGGTRSSPYGDPSGIIAVGIAFMERLRDWFGVGAVPVLGTEGGVYPIPLEEPQQPDPRYPHITRESHAEATVAMFNWMMTHAPAWCFGTCLWKEDIYFDNGLPALRRMTEVPQLRWNAVPRADTQQPAAPARGPGPVHGEPTFHAVVLAPGLGADWFFETARAYWNRFRPLVTTSWDFIDHIRPDQSLAVTVIAPVEMAQAMIDIIQQQYPNVLFDLIVAAGQQQAVTDVLNARVWSDRRFG